MEEYVLKLFANIRIKLEKKEVINFRIEKFNKTTFTVKVDGLYATIHINSMPWTYPTKKYWEYVGSHLIGNVYRGYVTHINDRNQIMMKSHEDCLEPFTVEEGEWYEGIVLKKCDYGIFIDIGYDNNWKKWSKIGLLHISSMADLLDIKQIELGQSIRVRIKNFQAESNLLSFDLGLPPIAISQDPLEIINQSLELSNESLIDRRTLIYMDYHIYIDKVIMNEVTQTKKQANKILSKIKQLPVIHVKINRYNHAKKLYFASWHLPTIPKISPNTHLFHLKRILEKSPYKLGSSMNITVLKPDDGIPKFVVEKDKVVKIHVIINGRSASTYSKEKYYRSLKHNDIITGTVTDILKSRIYLDVHIGKMGFDEEE